MSCKLLCLMAVSELSQFDLYIPYVHCYLNNSIKNGMAQMIAILAHRLSGLQWFQGILSSRWTCQ